MDIEQQDEWGDLENRAFDLIRKGSPLEERGVSKLFQIVVLPAFDTAVGWDICQKISPPNNISYFAVCTQWQRNKDLGKLETPVERLKHPRPLSPTIETRQVELTPDLVKPALNKFKSISIPAFVKSEKIGCDGTLYELRFGDGFVGGCFTWWEKPPIEWQPLYKFVSELLSKLEQNA